jgi:hypothetical protein
LALSPIDAVIDPSVKEQQQASDSDLNRPRRELVANEIIVGKDVAKKDTRKLLFGLQNASRHSFAVFQTPAY